MYNRRSFLKLTCATAFSGLMLGGSIDIFGQKKEYFPLPETIFSDSSSIFNQQTFEPLVDTIFAFKGDDDLGFSMKLIEVVKKDDTKKYTSGIPTDGFSLIFEVQGKAVAEDRIYQVSHSALNDFSMFISTVGKSGTRYQAVFNRVYF
jgi:hypothetical protein